MNKVQDDEGWTDLDGTPMPAPTEPAIGGASSRHVSFVAKSSNHNGKRTATVSFNSARRIRRSCTVSLHAPSCRGTARVCKSTTLTVCVTATQRSTFNG